jgi:hypothetical protein
MANKKILLGLTTTFLSDWEEKIEEITKFSIKEVALFPTTMEIEKRKKLYAALEKTDIQRIPHVHLRSDMRIEELDYLTERFKTEVFNIHPQGSYVIEHDLGKYKPVIFIENSNIFLPTTEELAEYGGICIDFAHWENARLMKNGYYKDFKALVGEHKIGCCHISGIIKKTTVVDDPEYKGIKAHDFHYINGLDELEYMKKYVGYLPDIISMEMENSFKEQLEFKKYLEEIIKNKQL